MSTSPISASNQTNLAAIFGTTQGPRRHEGGAGGRRDSSGDGNEQGITILASLLQALTQAVERSALGQRPARRLARPRPQESPRRRAQPQQPAQLQRPAPVAQLRAPASLRICRHSCTTYSTRSVMPAGPVMAVVTPARLVLSRHRARRVRTQHPQRPATALQRRRRPSTAGLPQLLQQPRPAPPPPQHRSPAVPPLPSTSAVGQHGRWCVWPTRHNFGASSPGSGFEQQPGAEQHRFFLEPVIQCAVKSQFGV